MEVFVYDLFETDREKLFPTRASCFIGVSKHLETIKALGLRPRAFICFSVFGYPDETLALVLEIVLNNSSSLNKGNYGRDGVWISDLY